MAEKSALKVFAFMFFLSNGATGANAEWVQIAPGYTLDYAFAYCDNEAMGVRRGGFAFGDPAFVGGFALGRAIRNSIDQDRFRRNCMTMLGWKDNRKSKKSTRKGNWTGGNSQK